MDTNITHTFFALRKKLGFKNVTDKGKGVLPLKNTSKIVHTELKTVQYVYFSEVSFKRSFQTGRLVGCVSVSVCLCVCVSVCMYSLNAHC